jgi:hypothetical protein
MCLELRLGLLPRGSEAAVFEPIDRIVEAIISPKYFASDDEAWSSKNLQLFYDGRSPPPPRLSPRLAADARPQDDPRNKTSKR